MKDNKGSKGTNPLILSSATIMIGIVIALLTGEVIVRFVAPQVPYVYGLYYNWWRWDPDLGLVLRPSHRSVYVQPEFRTAVVTNSYAMRDREFTLARREGTTRILTLGDSFTFGFGVEAEQTWPKVLERQLRSRVRGGPVEVINAGGASGFTPSSYYLFTMRYLDMLKPDVVVVGLFVGNDIVDELNVSWEQLDRSGLPVRAHHDNGRGVVNDQGMRVSQDTGIPLRYRLPIINRSHLLRLVGRALQSRAKAQGDHFGRTYLRNYPPDIDAALTRVITLFNGLNRALAARQIDFVVLMIPTLPQVQPGVDAGALGYVPPGADIADLDFTKPQKHLIPAFQQNGIVVVDPRPALQSAIQQGRNLYFKHDGHWTPQGHAVAGHVLAAWFATHGAQRPGRDALEPYPARP